MLVLFRWLFGFVQFRFIGGFNSEFLSDCYENNIALRDIKSVGEDITATCNINSYRALHRIARRHGGVTRIIKKRGLPFMLRPLIGRWGFFAGMLVFVMLMSLLSCFVWRIEITGNSTIGDATILAYLQDNRLFVGSMWSEVDRDKLSWDLMSDFDGIAWAHINKIGTTAYVELKEIRPAPIPDYDKLQGKNIMRLELESTVSRTQNRITLNDKQSYYRLNFFFISIPLYINKQAADTSEVSQSYLTINEVRLPIGITRYDECFYSAESYSLDDEALKSLAKKRLENNAKYTLDGFEVVNVYESYDISDDACTAKFSYIIRRKE